MSDRIFAAKSPVKGLELINPIMFFAVLVALVIIMIYARLWPLAFFPGAVILVGIYLFYRLAKQTYVVTDTDIQLSWPNPLLNHKKPLPFTAIEKVELFKASAFNAKELQVLSDGYQTVHLETIRASLADRVIIYANQKPPVYNIGSNLFFKNEKTAYFFSPDNAEEFASYINSKLK